MAETTVIKGQILTPRERIPGGFVVVEEGKITYVGREAEASGCLLDFREGFVVPGFVDLHVHGRGGIDVMDASPEGLDSLSAFLAVGGVTSYLATTQTASPKATLAAARAVKETAEKGVGGAEVLGLHMEGPYINPIRCGAQDGAQIRVPDLDELEVVHREIGGLLRMVTLAPEVDGGLEAIRWMNLRGIVPSAGHSDATYEEALAGVEAGMAHASHLFNAMRPFHHREPGIVGVALEDERVSVELIADGFHLHPATLRLVASTKGPELTALVSDAIVPAGLPDGEYAFGGRRVTMDKGRCLLESGGLAGSTISLCDAVRYMVERAGLSLAEVVEMCSTTPARIAGKVDRKGRIAPGMDADIVVLDRNLSVMLTMVGGRMAYRR